MATKWADFVIAAVRFNSAVTHIEEVQVYEHDAENSKLVNMVIKRRASVIAELDSSCSYVTAIESSTGNFEKGAEVKVYEYDSEKFIKTKADGIKKDNLDNLPTF
jgi:CRISPR/Cas system-associated protein Csm6